MNNSSLPIGVFDSGLGGLTVLKSLVEALPNENFIYLGDTARTPYGSKGPETIKRYSKECADFLFTRGVKAIIVACNTASSHSLAELTALFPCPVIGTVEPAVKKGVVVSKSGRVGVIGTDATIQSDIYAREFRKHNNTLSIISKSCPLFVPIVEQGMFHGEIVEKIVELYLSSLREAEVDTLVLGCTHYPLLFDVIQKFMGETVSLVACSEAIAEVTKEMLSIRDMNSTLVEQPSIQYFVTDAADRFGNLAGLLMKKDGLIANKIDL